MTDDTDTQEYRLRDDVEQVVRSGLVLKGDATVTLAPEDADEHADVLVATDTDTEMDTDTDTQEAEA